jgi:hypothetical protein
MKIRISLKPNVSLSKINSAKDCSIQVEKLKLEIQGLKDDKAKLIESLNKFKLIVSKIVDLAETNVLLQDHPRF